MRRIYSEAGAVRIWLGEAAGGSDDAVSIIRQLQVGRSILDVELNGQALSARDLRSFAALLYRPWWKRVWVMQEVALAHKAIFYCGNTRFTAEGLSDWISKLCDDMVTAYTESSRQRRNTSAVVQQFEPIELLLTPLQDLSAIATVAELVKPESTALISAIVQLTRLDATEPCDKVFGILGLLPPVFRQGIKPDYKMPAEACYAMLTWALILYARDLYAMCFPSKRTDATKSLLPSWSLDMSRGQAKCLDLFRWYPRSADKTWPEPFYAELDYPTLKLKGLYIDKISSCYSIAHGLAVEDPETSDLWYSLDVERQRHRRWQSFFGLRFDVPLDPTNYVAGGSMSNAHYRTLVGDLCFPGIDFSKKRRLHSRDIKAFHNWLYGPCSEDLDRWALNFTKGWHADNYCLALKPALERANTFLFRTKRGYIGMSSGPPDIRVGDCLYFLARGAVPYALRPVRKASGETTFDLAGTSYVHGITGRQATAPYNPDSKQARRDKLRRQLFGGSKPDPRIPLHDWQEVSLE